MPFISSRQSPLYTLSISIMAFRELSDTSYCFWTYDISTVSPSLHPESKRMVSSFCFSLLSRNQSMSVNISPCFILFSLSIDVRLPVPIARAMFFRSLCPVR